MRKRRKVGWGAGVCAVVVAMYGVAAAQTGQPASATVPSLGNSPAVAMQGQARLTPQQELVQADSFLSRMSLSSTNIGHQLQAARDKRDVVKSLCLNDKLNQVDVAIRSARDRRAALDQAVARADADLANHEFTILTVLRQRVEQLTAEANQCIGEEADYLGETRVSTTIDTVLPPEDTTDFPGITTVVVLPPPASPFK